MDLEKIKEIEKEHYMDLFRRSNICFERGEGCTLYDTAGHAYTDFFGGIAVSCLGHNDPDLVKAISDQAGRIIHTSNLYYNVPQAELTEKLTRSGMFSRVFFCNSGAEANECAIKIVRKLAYASGSGRTTILTARESFHGRTLATVTATGQEKYSAPFAPLPDGFRYVPFNDLDALRDATTPDVGAIMLECIQGEGGMIPATYDYLVGAYAFAKQKGLLLILDEVQTGTGRTGKFFCFEHYGIQPDIVTLAKGLGGGVPIACCLARGEAAEAFRPGDHGTTFGGGPLACAAANVVMDKLNGGLLDRVAEMGDYLADQLSSKLARHKFVLDIRGKGLLRGVQLDEKLSAAGVAGKMMSLGVIIGTCGHNTLRIAPPYIITRAEIDDMTDKLETIFSNTNI
ncbi:MAG TPA: aspartate aminotransferase family protein [Candidatus Protoclostridium stercorigallinarum]|uniref:Acetylornithine aminotransferase n=1 Tax=Candidatus Protoclostridium stercorigallinarum TaxID=2838741 RepID=A0A9D1Q0Z3_9FIRM|nr:aspartate aminotransferase family protein [Candidatus Protoclostridium stercorigallinarum]